ncbi:hypothetical protein NQ318_013656 [Aromia moschata]|uniref:Uncharacterized protein n=1 Tax=Aromia moschata TaxID=1265417 RepID=A0AAV8Y3N8_9CUCU|nr:hypothetical protein NQ318_013656 [Aromia moschata]
MSHVQTPKKLPFADKANKFIGDLEDLFYDGATIVLPVPLRDLERSRDKRDFSHHINSLKHKNKKDGMPLRTQFMFDLLLMPSTSDVLLNVLNKQQFHVFWNKYVPEMRLPGRTTLRNYLRTVRNDLLKWITSALKNR